MTTAKTHNAPVSCCSDCPYYVDYGIAEGCQAPGLTDSDITLDNYIIVGCAKHPGQRPSAPEVPPPPIPRLCRYCEDYVGCHGKRPAGKCPDYRPIITAPREYPCYSCVHYTVDACGLGATAEEAMTHIIQAATHGECPNYRPR